jgi:hypothetical protein
MSHTIYAAKFKQTIIHQQVHLRRESHMNRRKQAVYMLLWNMRMGFEHAGLDFWLSSVACHCPNAPVIIVGTQLDQV